MDSGFLFLTVMSLRGVRASNLKPIHNEWRGCSGSYTSCGAGSQGDIN